MRFHSHILLWLCALPIVFSASMKSLHDETVEALPIEGKTTKEIDIWGQKVGPGAGVEVFCYVGDSYVIKWYDAYTSKPMSLITIIEPQLTFDPPFKAIISNDTPRPDLPDPKGKLLARGTELYVYRRIGDIYVVRTARGPGVFKYRNRVPVADVETISEPIPSGRETPLGLCPTDLLRRINFPPLWWNGNKT